MCSPAWPGTPRNLPMSFSGVLELKACTTMPGFVFFYVELSGPELAMQTRLMLASQVLG